MELLSPAGSFDSLKAAVQNGADAVYLGASCFNARNFADNFTDIQTAVSYARLRGCKVHFTLNTLLLDREFAVWEQVATTAARAGIDAFIVQDIGGATILRELFPDIPLHASTQMTIHNTPAAQTLRQLGFSRLVLARELSAEQISHIKTNTGMELEIFVHGALCVCYSGQCLMSSILGGRSANRGMCAQPCRLPYTYHGKTSHLLSPKDLCLVDRLDEIQSIGVNSVKIEGRMKKPEYVAAVTRVYRKALDGGSLTQADFDMLALAFNRGGFTRGLFTGEAHRLYPPQPSHIGLDLGKVVSVGKDSITVKTARIPEPGDEIAPALPDAQPQTIRQVAAQKGVAELFIGKPRLFRPGLQVFLLSSADMERDLRNSMEGNQRKTPLRAEVSIPLHTPARLTLHTPGGICSHAQSDIAAEQARTHPLTYEDIAAQLQKTGDTPFTITSLQADIADNAALPKSALNRLRRKGIENLSVAILDNGRREPAPLSPLPSAKRAARQPLLAAHVRTPQQAEAAADYVDILYIPIDMQCPALSGKAQIVGAYPPIMDDGEYEQLSPLEKNFDEILTNCLISSPLPRTGDAGLNVMNTRSLYTLHSLGFQRATLSLELNAAQITDLTVSDGIQTEAVVYGRPMLMVTEHCPLGCDKTVCAVSTGGASLTDRKGYRFPLLRMNKGCRVALLNPLPVDMADKLGDIHADVYRLAFTLETPEECAAICERYRRALQGETIQPYSGEYTRGHYYRGVGGKG